VVKSRLTCASGVQKISLRVTSGRESHTLPVDSSFVTLSADQIAGLFLISDGLYCCLFPESDDLAQLFDWKILLQPGCDFTTEPLASGTPGYFVKKPGKSHVAESY
jgi:hypothetical protein